MLKKIAYRHINSVMVSEVRFWLVTIHINTKVNILNLQL